MYYYYGFDWSYWVVMGVSFIITLIAQIWVSSAMSKYSKVMSKSGLTGHEAALTILREQGIMGVSVTPIQGNYSDHYNPRNKNVSLSQPVFNNRSITAISVAAHECGHAVQDATNYGFLSFRTALVPIVNFSSTISWFFIVIGLFFQSSAGSGIFLQIGIILFSIAVLFQLVTLPVEFNASHRALKILKNEGMLDSTEVAQARQVLTAAAMTYVAAASTSVLQLIRLIFIARNNRD